MTTFIANRIERPYRAFLRRRPIVAGFLWLCLLVNFYYVVLPAAWRFYSTGQAGLIALAVIIVLSLPLQVALVVWDYWRAFHELP